MKKEPYLFTPGPLTTSTETKKSMMVDYGSWDDDFNKVTNKIRIKLVKIINGNNSYTCTPLQGSGSFGVEAMMINFIKKTEKVLILINGAYGERIQKICNYHKIKNEAFQWDEDKAINLEKLNMKLKKDKSIKHLAFVHCETSTGILNPLKEVSNICDKYKVNLLIDAMSTFGAIHIDSKKIKFKAIVASSNKCIEGVPGMAFIISKVSDIKKCKGNSDNLCMDLYDQWQYMENTGRWRYTPPTHVAVAFLEALKQHQKEGGVKGRFNKYQRNLQTLLKAMNKLGFTSLLSADIQSPIIVTFVSPSSKKFKFEKFYKFLKRKGYIIYPGKMAKKESFRIGCIGEIKPIIMKNLVNSINDFLKQNKITII
tara:strand:- start:714 stop:1820 length:1107 start_codon:yes stop_codon:yes gene_type:complete